jgi:hypothetical protein
MFVFALSLQQWSNIGEIVTGLGVLLVLIQVWQGARNSRVELITGMTTLLVEVDRLFVEYPEMRKYFEDGTNQPEQSTEEWERARGIAMTMANTLDHVVEHLSFMKRGTQRAWRTYIAEVHAKSPVLQELLENHREWWPGLQRQVRNNS